MAMPRKTRPKPPIYDDLTVSERVRRWRHEHPKENKLFQKWEAARCNIDLLVACASVWVIQALSGYPSTRQDTSRLQREIESRLRRVENSCADLAAFLSAYGPQAKPWAVHYAKESGMAAYFRSRVAEPFNLDRFGRGADLRYLVMLEEEIRQRTGKRPGEAQLRALLELTAYACGVKNFDYNSESLRKSLDHFGKNPRNKKFLRSLGNISLENVVKIPNPRK